VEGGGCVVWRDETRYDARRDEAWRTAARCTVPGELEKAIRRARGELRDTEKARNKALEERDEVIAHHRPPDAIRRSAVQLLDRFLLVVMT